MTYDFLLSKCFSRSPQTFGFNNARRHAINKDPFRISKDRKSLYRIKGNARSHYEIDLHTPAIPKCVWKTSTIFPGLLEILLPSESFIDSMLSLLRPTQRRERRINKISTCQWAKRMKEVSLSASIVDTLFKSDSHGEERNPKKTI